MSKILAFGIMISALGAGAASAAFGTVGDRINSIGRTVDKLKVQQKSALQSMDREWVYGGNSVKKYGQEVDKLDAKILKLTQRQERLRMLGERHNQNRADMSSRMGDVAVAGGIGMSMAAPGVKAAKFEDRVKQISIVGELYKDQGAEGAMASAIRAASVKYAVSQEHVAEGIEKLVAQGMDAKMAQKYAPLLAKVNMATRTEMGDLAELVYTLQTKFKLTSEGEVMQAVNALAKAGKLGQYELKQMAKGFPELGGAAASFGSKGLEGVREMGMMMQVMRAGAGTTGEADTYMSNWFSHMSAKGTQDHFEKVGINFEQAKLKLMIDKRVSAIEASFMVFDDYINKVTEQGFVEIKDKKGKVKERVDVRDELKKVMDIAAKEGATGEALQEKVKAAVERMGLSTVLQDIQATQAYLAYKNGKGKYEDGRKELAKGETDKTVDNDYAEQMKLATMQTQYMKVAVGDLMIEIGNRLAPAFGVLANAIGTVAGWMSSAMQSWPKTSSVVIGFIAVLAGATAGVFAFGAAMAVFRFAGTAMALMPILGGGLRMVGAAATMAVPLIRGIGTAMMFAGRAMLMTPIGWIVMVIAAVAAGAYLLYKNWGAVSSWFGKQASAFRNFGSAMIDGLVGGISSKLAAAKAMIVGLGTSIKGWFAQTLGIKSPSRVFVGFGANIGDGAQQGMESRMGAVKSSATRLAGVAAAAAMLGGAPAFAAGGAGGAHGASGSAGGAVQITFSPTIHVQGGDAGSVRSQVEGALQMSVRELEQMIRRMQSEQSRRAF